MDELALVKMLEEILEAVKRMQRRIDDLEDENDRLRRHVRMVKDGL